MQASLPMYDLPELVSATDSWWRGLARALGQAGVRGVPASLERGIHPDRLWRSPELLLSQTCGYPLVTELRGFVEPAATPHYRFPGCHGSDYSSFVLVGEDHSAERLAELRGLVCAVNGRLSQSGYNCLRAALAPIAYARPFFSKVIYSGSHGASVELVAHGCADVCAVDCVTYGLLHRYRPHALLGTRILCGTQSAPALPYVIRLDSPWVSREQIQDAFERVLNDPRFSSTRDALGLSGVSYLGIQDYGGIEGMARDAAARGYPEIR